MAIRPSTVASGRRRTAATRWAWIQALAFEISGSRSDAEVLTASTGIFATVSAGSYGLVQFEIGLDVFFVGFRRVLTLLGPWLENVLAAAL